MAVKSCVVAGISSAVAQVEVGYYSKTWPNVEAIVREEMKKIISAAPTLAGPLLRLHFHDCFVRDLVVLSGAHTLGTSHCPSYAHRLYNFSSAYNTDPSLDSEYADRLRTRCKNLDDKAMLSEMGPGSYKTFDTSYYHHVEKRRGLFQSDAALLTDATTMEYVQRIATGKFDDVFFKDFSESMIKMGNVGFLTGAEGQIRKKCYIVN
ncbi:Peroxidase 1 [Dichanthelium oligosanthes]|uniref:Peroxidase 1 n=1 Tax=Dichanthelium oligosanthes TaxID=888268 RepID=A0A1E5URP7_9POAL|nr:Peroxidase 1 [Dichanthelium oligosanthes]